MIGFSIQQRKRKVSAEVIDGFRPLPVANVSDCMSRMVASRPGLRPLHRGGVMAGPAFTVKTRPGDNLMVHKAIDIAEPGDIVVVDAGGDLTSAIIGELMLMQMAKSGLGGIVINGAVRDVAWIRQSPFPVYAAGVTHRGPYKDGPGVINGTIAIDGMVIEPGDLILGDDDGFVCVPYDATDTVLKATQAKKKAEEETVAQIEAGTSDRSWVDETLRRLGCQGLD